jgi:hypothetical protein
MFLWIDPACLDRGDCRESWIGHRECLSCNADAGIVSATIGGLSGHLASLAPRTTEVFAMPMIQMPQLPLVSRRCPNCWMGDVKRTEANSWPEYVLRLFLIYPCRCQVCGERFWRFI